ncbi:MarR family winged helix-turn-helix transcriptional regulator [Actinomadura roseirufa]|uniref:MarR family winged helix-turn-helix transcriptional regulator n=1 Tax=Actinomadura roseirufa TaxID=2094049 RepID=UPI0010414E3D|nr:MarR family winged helix-turn-helix transcriptional regulator [Actinomadura roseirufa]
MPDRPDPLRGSPSYLLFELVRLMRRTSIEAAPENGMRLPHLFVLSCVARLGPLSQREVSEHLRIDPGDLVGIVDALEDAGHVRRSRDPRDRRRYALEVTEAGRLSLGRGRAHRDELDERLFAALAPDELEGFKEMMLRILSRHDPRFAAAAGSSPEPGSGSGSGDEPRPRVVSPRVEAEAVRIMATALEDEITGTGARTATEAARSGTGRPPPPR